jgi:hypothetical protein
MNFGISVGLVILGAVVSSVITYLITRLRVERMSAERGRELADAVAALENEKARFDATAKGIEESAKRQALDEFLADLRIEERHYVRDTGFCSPTARASYSRSGFSSGTFRCQIGSSMKCRSKKVPILTVSQRRSACSAMRLRQGMLRHGVREGCYFGRVDNRIIHVA